MQNINSVPVLSAGIVIAAIAIMFAVGWGFKGAIHY